MEAPKLKHISKRELASKYTTMTAEQMAQHFGVSLRTIYRLIKRAGLKQKNEPTRLVD